MAFIEERLLECVSYGTSGGPTWRTRKVSLRSGVVRRNPMRSRPLYRYQVLYNNLQPDHHKEVYDAFNACYGGVHSFRMKDWHDFECINELLPVLGTGSSQAVQLVKTYAFGSQSVTRLIRKPVTGTVVLRANGTPISVSVDYTTGIITFTATAAATLRFDCEFDVPVMFEGDELPFTGNEKGANGLFLSGDVPLIEDTSV